MEQDRFDSCRYRSDTEIEFGLAGCCGSKPATGYVCFERDISGLTPKVCENCEFYEQRLAELEE